MLWRQPDVALLDIALRESDGIELALRVTADFKGKVRCTMVSMHMSSAYVLRPFGAGAQGYVVNDAGPAELPDSVHAVMAGQRCISPDVSGQLIDSMQRSITAAPHHALSSRQLEVLRLVAQGLTTKVIARALGSCARLQSSMLADPVFDQPNRRDSAQEL